MIEEIRAKYTADKINKLPGKTVLDIGCGNKLLKKYLNPNKIYTGVDISGNPDIEADATDLPFENNTFDIVNMSQILEHINPILAILEAGRILKNNGILFIDVPNPFSLDALLEWIVRKNSFSSYYHIALYGINEIRNISRICNMNCEYLNTRFILIPTFSRFKNICIPINSRIGGYNYFELYKP